MKKLLQLCLSALIVFMCFGASWEVLATSDAEFEAKYDYYCTLCVQRNLSKDQMAECNEFKNYVARKSQEMQNEINDLNKQMNSLKADIARQGMKINEINNNISKVESQIAAIETSIKNINANIKQIETEITEREAKIKELDDGVRERMYINQSRISAKGYINFIMGASSFSDLWRRISALNEITQYDVDKIHEIELEKEKLEDSRVELQQQQEELKQQQSVVFDGV